MTGGSQVDMAVNASTWVCLLLLVISLISLNPCPVSGDPSSASLTYHDDEDWADMDFSGSGAGQSQEDNTIRVSEVSSDVGKVIDLTIPENQEIPSQPAGKNAVKLTSDTIQVKPINTMSQSINGSQEVRQHKSSSKKGKTGAQKRGKKADKNSKKKKKLLNKSKQNGKTLNLVQSKSSVTLKEENVKKKDDRNYHIRRNNYQNSHQDRLRRRHHNRHHKKRWRKNMDSNRHGYGSKGTSRKRKRTLEDRWPGCFSKYQSCYRDSNCCNNNCHRFTWLSFGFCL